MLFKYVRGKNNQRVGVVVALSRHQLGWSKCNFKMGDKFDQKRCMDIAIERAKREKYSLTNLNSDFTFGNISDDHNNHYVIIPFSVREDYENMVHRAKNYFKN